MPLCRAVHRGDLRAFEEQVLPKNSAETPIGAHAHPPGRAPPLTPRSPRPQLALNQQLFIRHGSYLLVERSKMIAYRNFFRKVSPTHPPDTKTCRRTRTSSRVCPRPAFQVYELHTVPTTKLDLRRFKGCLAAASVPMEIDEIECILANLVYTGCALVCPTRAPITHCSPTRTKPRMRSLMTAHAVGTSRDISRISTPSSSLPRATPSRPCATCSVNRDADDAGPAETTTTAPRPGRCVSCIHRSCTVTAPSLPRGH